MLSDAKRLRILIPVLAFSSAGGMRVLSKLADEFVDMGHEVEFLGSQRLNEPYYPTKAKMKKFHNPFHHVALIRGLFNLFFMFIYLFRNRRYYDVVLANYNLTAFPVSLATLGTAKGFYYIQAYEPEFYDRKTIVGFAGYIMSTLSYFLPLHRIVNAEIYQNYKALRAVDIAAPGIDLRVFGNDEIGNQAGSNIIGCIGRKLEWKGTREIVQAVAKARDLTGLDLQLKIAFEVPDNLDISRLDFVELLFPHGDENLAKFYKRTSLFVATALLQDGAFHYPCLESMASGCIVISNYQPATSDNAIRLSHVTTEKITEAILEYLNFTEQQLEHKREQARIDVKKNDWPVIAGKMISFFHNRINAG